VTRGPSKQFDPDIALEQAMHVFWQRGYEAASLAELQQRMGIGKKSLYDTFGNKRALFLKALAHYTRTVNGDMRDRLLAEGSPLANLKQVLADWQRTHSRPGSCGCMLGTNIADFDTGDAEVAAILRGYVQQVEDVFCATLTRAQQAGELDPGVSPRDLARLLLCATQGMALLGRVMADETLPAGTVRVLSNLLAPG